MKKMIKIAVLLMFSFISTSSFSESSSNPDADFVKQTVTEFMKKNHIPGVAVELYVDGKPYSYYFGYANQNKKTPVTKNTIFEVGSISKLMTSLLLAQEVDAAKMQVDDSVTKYMRQLPDTYEDVSLKDLATHISGLPFSAPASIKTQADLNQYLTAWKPSDSTENQWVYSNLGIGMLGYAIEKATHQNINQLYLKQILLPLKMQPIALVVPKRLQPYSAQGYDKDGKPTSSTSLGLLPSAGGVKMSANDMQRFLSAAIGLPGTPDRIFYPMRMTQAAYVKLPDSMQGLGWKIHSLEPEDVASLVQESQAANLGPVPVEEVLDKPVFNGNTLIDKTGATEGFRAYIAVIPVKKSGIVILTNKYVSNAEVVNTGREILFKLAKLETKEPESDHNSQTE